MMWIRYGLTICVLFPCLAACADEAIDLNSIRSDLTVPVLSDGQQAAGCRFRMTLHEFAGWNVSHVVYFPTDWKPGGKHPVIVEYPGNGGYENQYGDNSTGRVEDCKLGYGISGGSGYVWVCLPFVDSDSKGHALTWWGDADATAAYCRAAVVQVCAEFGGDTDAIVLTGFSRGALACGYIGLRDEQTSKLWRAVIAHSHFDGVRSWNYPESDAESARQRLRRLGGRPVYITQEVSIDDIQTFLNGTNLNATIRVLRYPNHTDAWILKDIPERAELRAWLSNVMSKRVGGWTNTKISVGLDN